MGGQGSGGGTGLKTVFVPDPGAKLYERQKIDTNKSFEMFIRYRDMGPQRSFAKLRAELGKKKGYENLLGRWSATHGWRQRVMSWDTEEAEVARKSRLAAIEKANKEMGIVAESLWKLAAKDLARHHKRMQAAPDNQPVLSPKELALLTDTGIKLHRLLNGEATANLQVDARVGVQSMVFGEIEIKF